MGVCLTSACISLAISWLTRSIWRSLQGSPLLPSPSLAQPSVAQLDSVATVCPHPQSQSAPGSDPIRAPAIMSSLIWTCHTSPDTYPRHAVTFCPAGVKKTLPRFSPSPSLSHFACCFTLPFLFDPPRSLTLFPPCSHSLSWLLSLSLPSYSVQTHLPFPSTLFSLRPMADIRVCVRARVLSRRDNRERLRQESDDSSTQSPKSPFPRPRHMSWMTEIYKKWQSEER